MLLATVLAAAALAPSAVTEPATDVTATGATVHGTVAEVTGYYFEYGTTTAYGLATEIQPVTGTDPVAAEAQLELLTPNTTYHYRVVGTTAADGPVAGEDMTFRTAANPSAPAVAMQRSRDVRPTTATLSATVDPNGAETTYYFQYGTSTRYGTRTEALRVPAGTDPVAVTTQLSDLRPYTRYHWRLVATNDAGTRRGNDRTFRTARLPTAVTLALSRRRVTWGRGFSLGGRVTGAGARGMTLALQQQAFPFDTGFSEVGTTRAGKDGGYLFSVDNLWQTTNYRVVTKTQEVAVSPVVTARAAVRAGARVRHRSRRRARVEGYALPAVTGTATLQRRKRSGGWKRIRRIAIAPSDEVRSRYRFGVRRGRKVRKRFRVVVTPEPGGHVRGFSRSVYVSERPRRR